LFKDAPASFFLEEIFMEKSSPIIVTHLFPEILQHLLDLLSGLPAADWDKPTVCAPWSVKDVALHLLGDDVGLLSRQRDGFSLPADLKDWDELVAFINHLNLTWVEAARRTSPRLLLDLLRFTGGQVCAYFESLDPYALGGPVNWVGPEPAPVWLDLAREYTERWLHQQHLRQAVGQPGLTDPHFLGPALDAFVLALPRTYQDMDAAEGALVTLTLRGACAKQWSLRREAGRWELYAGAGASQTPAVEVIMDEDTAWRVFTKGLSRAAAETRITVKGDRSLGLKMLDTVSIIA
jgi:uncharacterized protein (TIGR03083 family)